MELILVRHSIAEGNTRHVFLGRTDTPLTEEGVALAKERSKQMPPVEQVYHSPMLRTTQTAALLWPGAPMQAIDGLREMDFGLFDGFTHEELMHNPVYVGWLAQSQWDGFPSGDTFAGMNRRVEEAVRFLLADGQARGVSRAGCVAHGGTIMAFAQLYSQIQLNLTDKLVKNCGGFRMDIRLENGAVVCSDLMALA